MRREQEAHCLVADFAKAVAARGQTIQTHTTNEVTTVSPEMLDVIRRMAAKIESIEQESREEIARLQAKCDDFESRWQSLRSAWSHHSQLFAGSAQ